MGGKHTTNASDRISALQLQSSAYAIPIPIGWGRARVGLNLIWAANFQSQQHDQNQSSGKGGGGSTSVSFTYTADVIFGICDTASGAVRGLNAIFRDKSVFSGATCVADAGFSILATGASGQAPWTYLSDTYPAQALGYDTIAYLAASNYGLNDQAGLQNHSVEIDFTLQVGGGIVDANPGYANGIVADFLINQVPQWSRVYIGDLTAYGDYCLAAGLLLSPVLDTQQQASDLLDEIMSASNAQCWIRGDGTLQVRPLADAAIGGNGVRFTPDLTPVYDLTSADFIVDDPADDPISIDTANLDDLYNYVQIQFQNREHQYNDETVPAFDQASIDEIGQRKQDPTDLPSIKDPIVARLVAQLLVQQTSSLARPFTFALPWCFDLLEEMDVVTISNEAQGLHRVLCRIQKIDEDGDSGKLNIQANEILVGTANAPVYPSQGANGTITDFEADPGDVAAPVLFIAPTAITNGAFQAWAAVSSTDPNWGGCQVWVSVSNADYKMVGTIAKGARFGTTVSELAAAADPDTADMLTVDLAASAGALTGGTQADADAATTLCWLGGELIAYRDVMLVGNNQYRLGNADDPYLRRGLYGSIIEEHPSGTAFVRLDSAIFKTDFLSAQIGQTLHVKFASFNIFGRNVQDLADVTEYTVLLQQPDQLPGDIASLSLQSDWAGAQFTVVASASAHALGYTFRVYDENRIDLIHTSNTTAAQSFTYTEDMAANDGHILRTYWVTATPNNESGDGNVSSVLAVSNPAPAAVSGLAKSGSGGSVTIRWAANTESDLAGYVAYYSQTAGFDPASGGGALFFQGFATSASLSSLTTGTAYHVRVAAYDTWSDDTKGLNFSAEFSFTA